MLAQAILLVINQTSPVNACRKSNTWEPHSLDRGRRRKVSASLGQVERSQMHH
jgi:hypothetical protein